MKKILIALALSLGLLVSATPAFADGSEMSDGVIRKIDMENGKITLRHGEIASLDMPPMSMVFNVKDTSMLETLSKGDKVKFIAADENGKLFVTEIALAK